MKVFVEDNYNDLTVYDASGKRYIKMFKENPEANYARQNPEEIGIIPVGSRSREMELPDDEFEVLYRKLSNFRALIGHLETTDNERHLRWGKSRSRWTIHKLYADAARFVKGESFHIFPVFGDWEISMYRRQYLRT